MNSPAGTAVANELDAVCRYATPPHERLGFVVEGRRVPITPYAALALDLSVMRGAARAEREWFRRVQSQERAAKGTGVNTVLHALRRILRIT